MFCANCGAEINDKAVVCPKCGVPVASAKNDASPNVAVPNHMVGAILTTVFCCLIGGIIAIVYASQVNTKLAQGDIASGRHITVRKPENPSPQSPITWDLDVRTAAPEIAHEFHAQDLWSVPDDNGEERSAPVSGYSAAGADSFEYDGAAWTRGETAGGDSPPRGVKITLPVRMQQMNIPAGYARIGWRTLEFDQNGCLVKVSKEAANHCFVVTAL